MGLVYLEVVLCLVDNLLLVLIVDLLAVLLRKSLKTLPAHEQNPHFCEHFARGHVASLFEKLLKLLAPPKEMGCQNKLK